MPNQQTRHSNLSDLPPREYPINDGDLETYELERLKDRLEYFFMDPLQKWKKKNTRPWKLLVQILKIFIFTTQLVVFGSDMAKFITYKDDMQLTFKQLFLKDWDPSADAIAYPGPYVPYAVYTKPTFFQSINYAIKTYSNITESSVGIYGYQSNRSQTLSPIDICTTNYLEADFEPTIFKYNYSLNTITYCDRIENYADAGSLLWEDFDFRNEIKNQRDIDFSKLISASVKLPLRTLLIEDKLTGDAEVVCFNIDIEINLDNTNRDGQIIISLKSNPRRANCQGALTGDYMNYKSQMLTGKQILNFIVIIFCLLSFSLCVRSIYRAYKLLAYSESVLNTSGSYFSLEDKMEFLDSWLVLIIINDLMILSASVIIVINDERLLETNNYTICSLLIGMGNFLSWAGLLRYLSFFKKYNLLIVTLRKSFPHVMRFMLCAMIIYW